MGFLLSVSLIRSLRQSPIMRIIILIHLENLYIHTLNIYTAWIPDLTSLKPLKPSKPILMNRTTFGGMYDASPAIQNTQRIRKVNIVLLLLTVTISNRSRIYFDAILFLFSRATIHNKFEWYLCVVSKACRNQAFNHLASGIICCYDWLNNRRNFVEWQFISLCLAFGEQKDSKLLENTLLISLNLFLQIEKKLWEAHSFSSYQNKSSSKLQQTWRTRRLSKKCQVLQLFLNRFDIWGCRNLPLFFIDWEQSRLLWSTISHWNITFS